MLDAAFSIHTDVGLHLDRALINGHEVQLSYELHNGDVVSIKTSEDARPQLDWLPHGAAPLDAVQAPGLLQARGCFDTATTALAYVASSAAAPARAAASAVGRPLERESAAGEWPHARVPRRGRGAAAARRGRERGTFTRRATAGSPEENAAMPTSTLCAARCSRRSHCHVAQRDDADRRRRRPSVGGVAEDGHAATARVSKDRAAPSSATSARSTIRPRRAGSAPSARSSCRSCRLRVRRRGASPRVVFVPGRRRRTRPRSGCHCVLA